LTVSSGAASRALWSLFSSSSSSSLSSDRLLRPLSRRRHHPFATITIISSSSSSSFIIHTLHLFLSALVLLASAVSSHHRNPTGTSNPIVPPSLALHSLVSLAFTLPILRIDNFISFFQHITNFFSSLS